jgi:hypothetical protein
MLTLSVTFEDLPVNVISNSSYVISERSLELRKIYGEILTSARKPYVDTNLKSTVNLNFGDNRSEVLTRAVSWASLALHLSDLTIFMTKQSATPA